MGQDLRLTYNRMHLHLHLDCNAYTNLATHLSTLSFARNPFATASHFEDKRH